MKKITFTMAFVLLIISTFHAQSIVFSDNFDDEDISDWTLIDEDGDGFDWSVVQIVDDMGMPVDTPLLRSASWVGTPPPAGTPLNPNNFIISPSIDLTGASGLIDLNWQVKASDAMFDAENYTVYVGTSNNIADLLMSTTTFNEPTLDGVNVLTDRTIDISSFAGEATVFIAFRHHDVSDEFTMEIDNVSITAETLSVEEFASNTFSHFYNKDTDNLSLESSNSPFSNLSLFNILGQRVINKSLSQSIEVIDISSLKDGIYLAKINIEGQIKTVKIMKQ